MNTPSDAYENDEPVDPRIETGIKQGVILTYDAGRAIRKMIDDGNFPPTAALRITASGNRVSGYHYDMTIVDAPDSDDALYLSQRVKIAVNRNQVEFFRGTLIDYEITQGQAGFRFQNPNEED